MLHHALEPGSFTCRGPILSALWLEQGDRTDPDLPTGRKEAQAPKHGYELDLLFAGLQNFRYDSAREHRLAEGHEFRMPLPDVGR